MKKKLITPILLIILIMSTFQMQIAAVKSSNPQYIGFDKETVIIYKNEHFDIDTNGMKTENITKWNKIEIEDIKINSEEEINVTWSLYEAIGLELSALDADPSLWSITGIKNQTSEINKSEQITRYGLLFNEKDTSLEDAPLDLLMGSFRIFYTNEMNYYEDHMELWSATNNVTVNTTEPEITAATSRTIEARINRDANIALNGTFETESNAWYNISLDLKLYLVYGMSTNLLLSYNINYTISESIWNNDTKTHNNRNRRQIIFWNVRRPTTLTVDYPVAEILGFPHIPYLEYYLAGAFLVLLVIRIVIGRLINKKNKEDEV